VPVDTAALKQRIDLLALISRDTRLRKVASTAGGEWAGPCPFCGGRDRFRVQPVLGVWWCRQCGGDRWSDAIDYLVRRDGVSFVAACRELGASFSELGAGTLRAERAERVPKSLELHHANDIRLADDREAPPAWQTAALAFVEQSEAAIWSATGDRARAYLHQRGLRDDTLRTWRLGFQPHYGLYAGAEDWGLDGQLLYLPRGIVLPWLVDRRVGHIQVRTSSHDPQQRYLSVRGGHPWLFGARTLVPSAPAILLEGALDTLLVWQEAGDLLGTASLGSCSKLPSPRAVQVLDKAEPLFEAYDADVEGEAGAQRLHQALFQASNRAQAQGLLRLRPPVGKDPTHFAQHGGSVRAWLQTALESLHVAAGQKPDPDF
jgi:DNA primase